MAKLLSVIVPSLDGRVPESLVCQLRGAEDVELVTITGVSPVGRARNQGFAQATGEYIAWVDSDDEVSGDWLAEIRKALANHPDVVTFDYELIAPGVRQCSSWRIRDDAVTIERMRGALLRDIGRHSMSFLYVTRRSLWRALRFDETVDIHEDFLLWPKVFENARSCCYLRRSLYSYRQHDSSLMHTNDALCNAVVIEAWPRRAQECPLAYRRACWCGIALNAYWICDAVALGTAPGDLGLAEKNAQRCRALIRAHIGGVLVEVLLRADAPMRERVLWAARFLCAAFNFWFLQRMRLKRRQRS